MKKMEEQKHFLALMDRPGDCCFIDIEKIDIGFGEHIDTLADLDAFTMKYTKEEIISSIKKSNLASERYLNGLLVIQDNQKHNPMKVIDKNFYNGFRIDEYLISKFGKKEELNHILNKFRSLGISFELVDALKKAFQLEDVKIAMEIIFSIPYLNLRKLMIYFVESRNKELEKQNLLDPTEVLSRHLDEDRFENAA